MLILILVILALTIFAIVLCPAGPPQRARVLPRPAGGQPHVDAGAQQSALDGQYGRHDPADLRPGHSDLPIHRGQLFLATPRRPGSPISPRRFTPPSTARAAFTRCCTSSWWWRSPSSIPTCCSSQQNYGDNLKRQGAQIPGVVRGAPTQKYLTRVQRRITLPGALFLGFVAVLPYVLGAVFPATCPGRFVPDLGCRFADCGRRRPGYLHDH